MADLDDFFAKKDKKKNKKGFSKANADVLAKNLEENERKEQKADEKSAPLATTEAAKAALVDSAAAREVSLGNDDEWLDYSSDKKDYSGLKIENLKVEDGDAGEESEHEVNDEGEKVRIKKGDGGPWNKVQATAGSTFEGPADVPVEEEPAPIEAKSSSGGGGGTKSSYVPPHLRGSSGAAGGSPAASGGARPMASSRRNRQAPDINSDINFPSLSGGSDDGMSRRGREGFEEVRSGAAQHSSKASTEGPRLALGNKFDALRD